MPELSVSEEPEVALIPAASVPSWEDDGRPRRKIEIALWLSVTWLVVLCFCAIFADFLPFVKSYTKIYPDFKAPPSAEYWFGTTKIGKDVFAQTIYGARLSLLIGITSIFFGLLLGGLLGLLAGYHGKRVDGGITIVMDIMLSFPALVLALAITSFLGPRAETVILTLAILSIPPLTRIVRATTLVYSNREFVMAARSLGAKSKRVVFREILPNVMPSMLSFALTGLAVLIIAEGALSFLGASVPPPQATWGKIIAEGRTDLQDAWWISLLPAAVLFLTVLAFNVIGDVLSKRFDIRESSL